MVDLVLPDRRFEMPELFTPGAKPPGPVIIDTTDDLWSDLYAYYLINNPLGASAVREISDLHGGLELSPAATNSDSVSYAGNTCVDMAANEYYEAASVADFQLSTFTVTVRFNLSSYPSANSGFVSGPMDDTVGGYIIWLSTAGVLRAYIRDGSTWKFVQSISPLQLSKTVSISHVYDGSNIELFVDKISQGTTVSGSPNYTVVTAPFSFGRYHNNASPVCKYFSCVVHERALTTDEIIRLHSDPYTGLVPE